MFRISQFIGKHFIGLLFLIPAVVLAQDQETVTLDQLLDLLLRNNPQIQAAEARHQAALARPSQVRTLPDPLVSFVSRNGSGNPVPFTELGKDPLSSIGAMWEQDIPYPGKLTLAGNIAEKEADSIGADADTVKSSVIAALKQAYYEYFRTTQTIRILNESRDLLKWFESIAEGRYRVGQAIQQDVLRAQVEVSILDQKLTMAEQEKASSAAEINRLLNKPVQATLPEPADLQTSTLTESLEKLQPEYSTKAPQIRSAEAMVQRENLGVDLAKKQYRPDFMSSVEYSNSPNFPDMWELQFGARIPIFYNKKQSYAVAEATQNLNRAERELAAMKQEVSFNIRNDYLQLQSSEKLLQLYEQAIIPQSNLALESGIASYQVGKADFLTTISNFLTILEYRMSYFEEIARHESAIARLEQSLGRSLSVNLTGDENHE